MSYRTIMTPEGFEIKQCAKTGYIRTLDITTAFFKNFNSWKQNKCYQMIIRELTKKLSLREKDLIFRVNDPNAELPRGCWAHPELVCVYLRSISSTMEVWGRNQFINAKDLEVV